MLRPGPDSTPHAAALAGYGGGSIAQRGECGCAVTPDEQDFGVVISPPVSLGRALGRKAAAPRSNTAIASICLQSEFIVSKSDSRHRRRHNLSEIAKPNQFELVKGGADIAKLPLR